MGGTGLKGPLGAFMTVESEIKQQVREFYDQVGWVQVSDGVVRSR